MTDQRLYSNPHHLELELGIGEPRGGLRRVRLLERVQLRPSWELGTSAVPSRCRVGSISSSMSRVHSEYWVSIALIGWVLWARRVVLAQASQTSRWRTWAWTTSCAMAPTVAPIGTFGS